MKEFDFDDEIIELTSENDIVDDSIESENEGIEKREWLDDSNNEKHKSLDDAVETRAEKYYKKSLKEKWQDLSKGKKATIIILIIVIILAIVCAILYFVLFKDNKPTEAENKGNTEEVIIEKDNYKYVNGSLVFLDSEDKEIGTYECTNKDDTKCLVAKVDNAEDKFERILNVDKDGNEIVKSTPIYLNKYVFIQDGEDKFLYDIVNTERLIELKSIKVYDTKENLAVVQDTSGKYGLMKIKDSGYDYLIASLFNNLGIINSELNYLYANDGSNNFIVDSNGKKLSSNFAPDIQSVSKDYIVAKSGSKYSLYNYKYEELLVDYDYIGFNGNVISLVKGNRLYLVDNKLNKLNEDSIRLESTDNLVKVNVYDNKKLKEVLASYTIEVKDNKAYITTGKTMKNINILEGVVSSNYELMSYYDGKLYFYSDKDKAEIIGTYNCVNPNDIKSDKDTLTNCHVYTQDDSYSGIYNNNYVFIYDNLNTDENNIYLYDFNSNKSRSTYSYLNIVNSNELSTDVKPVYTSLSYVISKSATGNNSGNFGVLEINGSGVKGKIDYKFKNIQKENDYYLFTSLDNSQSVYNKDFEAISNGFDYIKLYDNYYAGVIANKLNVYSYNNALGILESSINVVNNEFSIDFTDGIKITIGDKIYKYDNHGKLINDDTEETPKDDENKNESGDDNGTQE